jgi:leader peptidase (prepilin peptidase)/N-methyltransferase
MDRVYGASGIATLSATLGVAAVSFYALAPKAAVVSCLLGWAMLAIAAIDARRFMIPDALSLPAIALGLLASGSLLDPASDGPVSLDHVIGAGLGGAGFWLVREAYRRLRGREGLGLGDIKLAAAAGAWTGWEHLSDVVLLASATALGFAVLLAAGGRKDWSVRTRIPFGAFLAPAIWIAWLLRSLPQGF